MSISWNDIKEKYNLKWPISWADVKEAIGDKDWPVSWTEVKVAMSATALGFPITIDAASLVRKPSAESRWGTYVKISDFAPTPAELANAEMTFTATIDGETVSASMPVNTDNSTQDNFVVLDNITLLRITPDYWVFSAPVAGEIEFYEYFTVTIPEPGCYLLICDASGEFIYDSIVFDLVN